ncbi:MAG: amidohydrolase [Actinomycetes bacterium]
MAVDLLARNGAIWTGDPDRPFAESLLVRDGRLAWLGPDRDARQHTGPGIEVVDLGGRRVLPGFVDSHLHARLGSGSQAVQLAGASSIDEIRSRAQSWLVAHPDASWVYGEGFDHAAVPGDQPRKEHLVGVGDGRPVMLLDYSVHSAWLNQTALDRFGITASTATVPFGTVVHDDATGGPTGWITDFATSGLSAAGARALRAQVPAFSDDAQRLRVTDALAMAARFGITTMVEPQNSLDDLAMFAGMRDDGVLSSRVVAALFHPPATPDDEADALWDAFDDARRTFSDDWLRAGPVKLYIDDIVEAHTASMLDPYATDRTTRGRSYWEPESFGHLVSRLDARGFQCLVHATGDRGARIVLDAFEHARRTNGPRDSRHQIVHAELVHPLDQPRFAELGVVACMQPRHATWDICAEWAEDVGEERWGYAFPLRDLVDRGATTALSSDWNVAEMDPLLGLYAATTRSSLDGRHPWTTHQRVDLDCALRGYTSRGAWANFADESRGTLTVGRYGDFVALSDDIVDAPPEQLLETAVDLTVVGGRVVHRVL